MTSLNELTGTYVLDTAHTEIGFTARHAMVTKVRGSFDDYTGEATVDGSAPETSTLNVTIQVASVDTRSADRDAHLRSADFFDVEKYPTITFVGTGFDILDAETVNVTGDLTIKDVTRSITIPLAYQGEAKDPFGNDRIGFEGQVQVSRQEFGLTWNAALETGGVLVSDKVTLEFDVSAIKKA